MDYDQSQNELARRFHLHVVSDADYLKKRGYSPTYFLGMIRDHGSAVTVAKLLLSSTRHTTDGFERLWEMGELARSVEFAALLPWFAALFTDDELDQARLRLAQHEFPVEEHLTIVTAHPPAWASD